MSDDRSDDYEVGYGKPPKPSRFKPGQSGNPAGRAKGSKGLKSALSKTMSEKVIVRTANGPRKMAKIEAYVQKTFNDALSGNQRAAKQLLDMIKAVGLEGEVTDQLKNASADNVNEADQAILARFLPGTETT